MAKNKNRLPPALAEYARSESAPVLVEEPAPVIPEPEPAPIPRKRYFVASRDSTAKIEVLSAVKNVAAAAGLRFVSEIVTFGRILMTFEREEALGLTDQEIELRLSCL